MVGQEERQNRTQHRSFLTTLGIDCVLLVYEDDGDDDDEEEKLWVVQ